MAGVTPQTAIEHAPAIGRVGLEPRELRVPHDFETESNRKEYESQGVDDGEGGRPRRADCDEERKGDEPQDRSLQPEDYEEASPPEGRSVRGAHRLIARILPF